MGINTFPKKSLQQISQETRVSDSCEDFFDKRVFRNERFEFERERVSTWVQNKLPARTNPAFESAWTVAARIALTSKHTHARTHVRIRTRIVARWDQMLIPLIPLGNKVRNQFTERGTGRKAVDSGGDISQRVRPVCRRWGIEIAGRSTRGKPRSHTGCSRIVNLFDR